MAPPRCFLAVPVEEPALGAAAGLLEGLREEFEGVRWARPEGLHDTVHFFGPLAEASWDAVCHAVAPACAAAPPFTVRLGGLGAFPFHGPPRVLWLGATQGAAALDALASACVSALAAHGVSVDPRGHTAHVTLGRPRERWAPARRRAWAERAAELPGFTARRVVLFESLTGAGGSRYEVRRELPLGG